MKDVVEKFFNMPSSIIYGKGSETELMRFLAKYPITFKFSAYLEQGYSIEEIEAIMVYDEIEELEKVIHDVEKHFNIKVYTMDELTDLAMKDDYTRSEFIMGFMENNEDEYDIDDLELI